MIKVLSKVTTVTFNFITKQDFQNYQYNNISTQKNREEGAEGHRGQVQGGECVCVSVCLFMNTDKKKKNEQDSTMGRPKKTNVLFQ